MRTGNSVDVAINKLAETLLRKDLSVAQGHLLMGMVVALSWVKGTGGSTLQDLIDGRPLETEDPIEDKGEMLDLLKRRYGGKQ